MNSSLRSSVGAAVDQLGRQRRGLQRVLAALVLLLLAGGDAAPSIAATTFSSTAPHLLLLRRAWSTSRALVQLLAPPPARTMRAHRRGAEHLLGLPLELRLGQPDRHDGGEPVEDVLLVTGSSLPSFSSLALPRNWSLTVLSSARSKPATWVPPLGVAMMLTNDFDRGVVAAAPAQRHVDVEVALHLGGRHVALVVEDRHGLGEVPAPLQPPARH